ncbi:tripartite tricarboxylate transporter substrate binding protein [Halomonas sp. SpR8]|uniref:tripartite tricarboxylate transporter substrate binding protein n=1 Tax=Halomonas sp. SpR8 TaxID=3050463 RepID=UPI0027E409EA|nr:tripartite tricarboxylate transporter substrate binding protein [Halomonas sp. SpR8]MDQ7729646.1 tripartite tricarboxylate transporter substrate binding protein [Halomonas sp. SpR8]
MTKMLVSVAVISAVIASAPVTADDSEWPQDTVRIIMHTKAGGSADVFMRTLAESLEPQIGQSIAIINSPGGGGASQMSRVRSAEPDGLTLAVNTLSHFTGMLTNLKGVFAIDDFSWIATAQSDPNLIWTQTDSPIGDLDDLINEARQRDGKVTVGGFGPQGSTQHIGLSMLENVADVEFEWVPFNSTPDIVAAVLGGHIDVGMSNLSGAQAYFDAGRLKGLGVHGEDRLESLPDVATFEEQGYEVDSSWVQVRGIFGPAGMPMELQQQIADAFHEAMKTDHYQAYARSAGVTDSWMGPEEYTEFAYRISEVAQEELDK